MKKLSLLILAVLLVSGCVSQVYESQRADNTPKAETQKAVSQRAETNWRGDETGYRTYKTDQFTLTYPEEWIEPKHYTRDYYYFQLADFMPWIHLSVFDIEEFEDTASYYEEFSELFYTVFDFQEIEHYVTEDEVVIRGTMVDEEGDELTATYKVVVCEDVVLALDVSGLSEEYAETKEMIDKTVKSFKCV
jgi:hypothetical protein